MTLTDAKCFRKDARLRIAPSSRYAPKIHFFKNGTTAVRFTKGSENARLLYLVNPSANSRNSPSVNGRSNDDTSGARYGIFEDGASAWPEDPLNLARDEP